MNISVYSSVVAMEQIRRWITSDNVTPENMKMISKVVDIDELMKDIELFLESNDVNMNDKNIWRKVYQELDNITEVYSVCDDISMCTNDSIDELAQHLMRLKFNQEVSNIRPRYQKAPSYLNGENACIRVDCEDTYMSDDLEMFFSGYESNLGKSYDTDFKDFLDEINSYKDCDMENPYASLVSKS